MPDMASARRLTVDVRSPLRNVSVPVDTPAVARLNDTDTVVPLLAADAVTDDLLRVKSLPLRLMLTASVRFAPFMSMARDMV